MVPRDRRGRRRSFFNTRREGGGPQTARTHDRRRGDPRGPGHGGAGPRRGDAGAAAPLDATGVGCLHAREDATNAQSFKHPVARGERHEARRFGTSAAVRARRGLGVEDARGPAAKSQKVLPHVREGRLHGLARRHGRLERLVPRGGGRQGLLVRAALSQESGRVCQVDLVFISIQDLVQS